MLPSLPSPVYAKQSTSALFTPQLFRGSSSHANGQRMCIQRLLHSSDFLGTTKDAFDEVKRRVPAELSTVIPVSTCTSKFCPFTRNSKAACAEGSIDTPQCPNIPWVCRLVHLQVPVRRVMSVRRPTASRLISEREAMRVLVTVLNECSKTRCGK